VALLTIILATCVFAASAWPRLLGCAVAPREGDHVAIASETALIIWDAEAKVQHFIRRATFDTKADDFGFLVPTPSRPDLGEAHDYTFKMLEKITAPEVRTSVVALREGEPGAAALDAAKVANAVEVVESKRVGDFDAVVLKASDAGALEQWLQKHGYVSDEALADWLEKYVSNQWFLTAFKIAQEAKQKSGRAAASAVRMSFATDTPFFPYSEPSSDGKDGERKAGKATQRPTGLPGKQRLLRVYLLAKKRMEGTLGDAPWPGTTVWAGAMPKPEQDFLMYAMRIHEKVKGDNWFLTEMEDRSSPRPGTHDVYFAESQDPSPVRRPPIIDYVTYVERNREFPDWAIRLGLILAALVVAFLGVVFLFRPRRAG
jgi:hypothetical protein